MLQCRCGGPPADAGIATQLTVTRPVTGATGTEPRPGLLEQLALAAWHGVLPHLDMPAGTGPAQRAVLHSSTCSAAASTTQARARGSAGPARPGPRRRCRLVSISAASRRRPRGPRRPRRSSASGAASGTVTAQVDGPSPRPVADDEAHRLGPRPGVGAEVATHHGGHGGGARLVHPPRIAMQRCSASSPPAHHAGPTRRPVSPPPGWTGAPAPAGVGRSPRRDGPASTAR